MAENEILDVGSSRRYRRWHKALADPNCSPSEVAESLVEDFGAIFMKKLRGPPLHIVLKACGDDRKALQEAVSSFKDRDLAKLVEQAFAITRSKDPLTVAKKIAELLIDGVLGQSNRYALRHEHFVDAAHHQVLDQVATEKMEARRLSLVESLAASLRGERIPRQYKRRLRTPSPESVVMSSLMQGMQVQSNGGRRV